MLALSPIHREKARYSQKERRFIGFTLKQCALVFHHSYTVQLTQTEGQYAKSLTFQSRSNNINAVLQQILEITSSQHTPFCTCLNTIAKKWYYEKADPKQGRSIQRPGLTLNLYSHCMFQVIHTLQLKGRLKLCIAIFHQLCRVLPYFWLLHYFPSLLLDLLLTILNILT